MIKLTKKQYQEITNVAFNNNITGLELLEYVSKETALAIADWLQGRDQRYYTRHQLGELIRKEYES